METNMLIAIVYFLNCPWLMIILPQQENSFDCGLFLLHYLELFLAEAPSNFNPFKLTKFSNFLNVDWFLPAEAYLKRTLIQRLIFELVENNGSHEITTSDCSDDPLYIENDENRTGAERPEVNSESTTSLDRQGIEITLLTRSSSLDPQSLNNSGLVLKEFFEPGATAGTILDQCQSFDQRSSDYRFNGSMLEEDSGLGEQFMYLTTDPNFQQVAGITPQADSLSYLPRDCGDETIHIPEVSLRAEQGVVESSLAASTGASDDSGEIRVTDNCPVGNEPRPSTEAERDEKKCSPTENHEHFIDISSSVGSNLPITSVTEISQYSIMKCDGDKHEDLHCFYLETPTIISHQVTDAVACDDGQINDGMAPDICEEQAAKRRRLMPLENRSEGMVTESNL
ncbi:Ulp1 protease family, C-terminal catalytic domain [Sesbania bispinosa]|nr:Ulp1 protease family, C-terminal catalytic domain [Sesbania bispinosa]